MSSRYFNGNIGNNNNNTNNNVKQNPYRRFPGFIQFYRIILDADDAVVADLTFLPAVAAVTVVAACSNK